MLYLGRLFITSANRGEGGALNTDSSAPKQPLPSLALPSPRFLPHHVRLFMSVSESHLCRTCDEPASRRCGGCLRVWRGKPIKTSYYLYRAALEDRMPDHAETLEDYGFERVLTNTDRSHLLGLYIGLFLYHRVHPRDVHNWRINGTLIKEIKAVYEKLPVDNRGGYYPWFLANQYVLDHSLPLPMTLDDSIQDVITRSWRFTGGSRAYSVPQIEEEISKLPLSRQICHELYHSLLFDNMSYPAPSLASWVRFGFCTCSNAHEESSLGVLYQRLIHRCTFDEFAGAFEAGELLKLMDFKGFKGHRHIAHMEEVLGSGSGPIKSVWYLKQLVEVPSDEEHFHLHPAVRVDYGFINCSNETEFEDLKALYKQVLDMPRVNPLELHEAAIRGKIFEFVTRFVKVKKNVVKQLQRLLRNPYPLSVV
ncbi:hypothetical protein LshimejAT787_0110690 [Lyophyllum shimeji]|uniref:Uncharacterized protein n=1 Tax=Lyophyllum shimeji TaxID=47721 RepID=A0A9P3PDY0_LYOSH|nr:hypothetical protein LshimejAT787_0110690 [Lyophyllum shimeji]